MRRPFAGLMLAGASACLLSAVAIGARYAVWHVETHDYLDYTRLWYNTIRREGFHSFSHRVGDYTPPYLYALYAVSKLFPDLSALTATKLPGTIGDFLCSAITFVFLRRGRPWPLALAASFAVLLSPTGIVNSALWGQSDSVYTAGYLGASRCSPLDVRGGRWRRTLWRSPSSCNRRSCCRSSWRSPFAVWCRGGRSSSSPLLT